MTLMRAAIAAAIAVPVVAVAAVSFGQAQTATRFVRDPALMAAKQAQIVAAVRAEDPQTATQLEASFRQDVVAAVAPIFAKYGFSTDDVADMTAAYWIIAWEASQGLTGTETDRAVARGVRDQLAGTITASPQFGSLDDAGKQDIADTMLLQGLIADARMTAAKQAGPAQLKAASDAIYREAQGLLNVDLRAVDMTAAGFTPKAAAAAKAGASPNSAPRGGGATPAVEGMYFRATYGIGAAIDFEPLIFFANGDYVEIDDIPLPDLNAAADKARAPINWGTWRKRGGTFLLTDSKGRTSDYTLGEGNFFPAFTAEQGPRLAGSYTATSGGGDVAMGGSVSTLATRTLVFNPNGSFTQGSEAGAIAPNAAAGSRRSAAGRWSLSGTTLDLTFSDGQRTRTSFLWGASGTPPRPDIDMIFIGGDVYLRDD